MNLRKTSLGGIVPILFGWTFLLASRNASACFDNSFEDISYNHFKDVKASLPHYLQFKFFRRVCNFENAHVQRISKTYAKLVGGCSSSIDTIVGHTIGKDLPYHSPEITPGGGYDDNKGFTVEARYGYPLAYGYRTELKLWKHDEAPVDKGNSYYYSFQFKIDKSFPVPTNWFIINQLHQMPGSYSTNHATGLQPPFSVQIVGAKDGSQDLECRIVLKSHSGTSLQYKHKYENEVEHSCGTLPRDKWLRLAVFVKPSPTTVGGIVGVHVADMSKGFSTISASLYTGHFAYNNGGGIRNSIGVYMSAGNKGNYKITFDNVHVD